MTLKEEEKTCGGSALYTSQSKAFFSAKRAAKAPVSPQPSAVYVNAPWPFWRGDFRSLFSFLFLRSAIFHRWPALCSVRLCGVTRKEKTERLFRFCAYESTLESNGMSVMMAGRLPRSHSSLIRIPPRQRKCHNLLSLADEGKPYDEGVHNWPRAVGKP